ncbi:peroxiredoxin family protein [Lentibacillus cibarius]|uniref:TlpA family protein disulfide reductase n=1 Tax=Lentibacillus cibarius TaxID=2583219 RepID=A0A5S3QLT1_9BACI|nr:TlpA disulfide reductase family protein [Lentibacillus cibarius]TMN22745.1 TlpA family protein disulfide reductase [Lentibacillus cibarius]
MKKTAIIVVLTGMFVWAVYDLVISSDDSSTADDSSFTSVEEGTQTNDTTEEEGDAPEDSGNSDTVGLQNGNIAPDFELKTLEGEQVLLSDYRGQRVVLNFWASWCPPCQAEVPDLQKFYENKDVEILAVNLTKTETRRSDVTDFVDEYGMTFPILMDETSDVAKNYQIQPIPTSYFINSKGRIQYKRIGAMNYETMVQEFEKMK